MNISKGVPELKVPKILILVVLIILTMSFTSCKSILTGADKNVDSDTTTDESFEDTEPVTEPPPIYDFPTDPDLYEPVPEEEYGLSENFAKAPAPFVLQGTLRSATGTSLNLLVKWKAVRKIGDDHVSFTADLAIEHGAIKSQKIYGVFYVDGNEYPFTSPAYNYYSTKITREWVRLVNTTLPCGYGEETIIDIKAVWDFVGNYGGRSIDKIELNAKVPIGEKYAALKSHVNYDIDNILQIPELPEGCEVTSLAIVLKHLGFDVTHTYLADNYLEQGPAGETSYYEYNIGNPREEGKSWGCYAPVILKTANKYLADQESYYRAYNLTGYDISEIYYQLSLGHPVIVWVTMNFEEPYIKSPWTVDGEKLYWKYPLHCVVLSGYDMENKTVTITDPLKNNPVIIDMETFELRWKQMESQAIIIKESKLK